MGVHLMGLPLTGVHLMGVCLVGMCLTGVHLIGRVSHHGRLSLRILSRYIGDALGVVFGAKIMRQGRHRSLRSDD
jgi:hypothetical protein